MARPSISRPPIPDNEPQRLQALRAFDILETAEEELYDQITAAAAEACEAPIALISFVDEGRQWCKSHHGTDWRGSSRADSFCGHAILSDDIFVVEDTHRDERFRANPFVTGPENIRFYAGVPLRTPEGHALGTLCVVDNKSRTLSPTQRMFLRNLAHSAMRMLMLRRHHGSSLFAVAVNLSSDAIAISDATNAAPSILYANRSYLELTGCRYHEIIGRPFYFPCPPETGDQFLVALSEARTEVVNCDLEIGSRHLHETITFVPYLDQGCQPIYCVVIHRDRTAEKRAEVQGAHLHAMQTTMRSINHVVLNFMNAAALYRRQMEGKMDLAALIQFDMALENTRAQLSALASMAEFKERKTPFGFTMLDPQK